MNVVTKLVAMIEIVQMEETVTMEFVKLEYVIVTPIGKRNPIAQVNKCQIIKL